MTDRPLNVNAALVVAMRAEAAALEAQAAAKRAQAAALEQSAAGSNDGELLTAKQSREQYNLGHDGLLNANRAGKLEVFRGARNQLMVERCALEAYIKGRPVKPRKAEPAAESLDDWEKQAQGALRSAGGGKK